MLISNGVIFRCKCGLSRCNNPLLKTYQLSFMSSNSNPEKVPKPIKTEKFNPSKPLRTEQLKLLKDHTYRLADALKMKYQDTLKAGTVWYQSQLNSFSQRKNGIGGNEWYTAKVGFWMKRYENFVGLTEVKAAQHRVVETEKLFIEAQDSRRDAQIGINEVQTRIKALHGELEKTHRGEDRYLTLITQEHQILKEERFLTERLSGLEKAERIRFAELSTAVRDSHEKERAQAEKTKYWSVIGSVVGTCLGILGTTINNRMRMKELRQIVRDASMATTGVALTTSGVLASSAVTTASLNEESLAQIKNLFDVQQKDIKSLSGKIVDSSAEMSTQIKEIGQISKSLSEAMKAVKSSSESSQPVYPPVSAAGLSTKDLKVCFENQQKALDKHFSDLKMTMIGHSASAGERLAIETIKRAEENERKLLEALNRTNVASYKAFHTRACEIDEKVKDIRSLILAQAMTSINPAVAGPVANHGRGDDFERSQRTIIGTVELALQEHEERVRSSVVLAGIFTAILTPLVLYALDKLV